MQVITLAFLVVACSVGVMIPIMLYVLDLHSSGWTWQYVALFISMLASTDAVAIIATMKTGQLALQSSTLAAIGVIVLLIIACDALQCWCEIQEIIVVVNKHLGFLAFELLVDDTSGH